MLDRHLAEIQITGDFFIRTSGKQPLQDIMFASGYELVIGLERIISDHVGGQNFRHPSAAQKTAIIAVIIASLQRSKKTLNAIG